MLETSLYLDDRHAKKRRGKNVDMLKNVDPKSYAYSSYTYGMRVVIRYIGAWVV